MATSLNKFLKSLGLEDKAQEVYLTLLGLGDAPAALVAKKAKIKRTTAYHILNDLIERGLVSSYKERGFRRFIAENPRKLKTGLEAKILALDKYLPQLEGFYNLSRTDANVRFFEGEEGVKQISEEALNCKEKIIYSIGSVQCVKGAIGTSIRFTNRRMSKRINSRALRLAKEKNNLSPDYIKKSKEELREVRFLPENIDIPVMILIFDNKVGVISPKEEGFGFIVESEATSIAMKNMFEILWKKGKISL